MSRPSSDAGFSLVEGLVALAVFAMAGVALVQLQSESLLTFARVETRSLADIAAQNRLTSIAASRAPPAVGVSEERVTFANRSWRIVTTVAETPGAQTIRVTVAVSEGEGGPISVAHAFLTAEAPT